MTFTVFGFLVIIALFLVLSSGQSSGAVVMFLAVVLFSMVLLNWDRIRPLFIKEG